MCDYSLEMYASRPARESEKYVTTRFPSGSIGLAAPGDCTTAVCVQYDTRLKLEGISMDLQNRLGIKVTEEVVFAPPRTRRLSRRRQIRQRQGSLTAVDRRRRDRDGGRAKPKRSSRCKPRRSKKVG